MPSHVTMDAKFGMSRANGNFISFYESDKIAPSKCTVVWDIIQLIFAWENISELEDLQVMVDESATRTQIEPTVESL